MITPTDRAYALARDAADPLTSYRSQFVDDGTLIYMDGNSLGRLPHATATRLRQATDTEWGQQLIRGWQHGWYEAPQRIGDAIGGLLGAAPGTTIACDSTSINLFKLVVAALRMRPGRTTIVSDTLNFPSDLYIIQGAIDLLAAGHTLQLVPAHDGLTVRDEDLNAVIDDTTALVLLSHVAFKSGFLYDMAAITRQAHAAGALVLWDLSHSAGVIPTALDTWNVDFAVGCCYKYLNGGPGAPAYLYVNARHQQDAVSPIWGWFGRKAPFGFDLDYTPAAGIDRWLAGTPPMLSLLAIEPGVAMIAEAGIDTVRAKAVALTEYAIALVDALPARLGFSIGSPRAAVQRGSHVSVRHAEGYRICRALIERLNVLPDFREPDNIRLGMAPLTTSFVDVWETIDRIRRALDEGIYTEFSATRNAVT